MTPDKAKEQILVVHLVGAAGLALPVSRPLFILLTPILLLFVTGLLLYEYALLKRKHDTVKRVCFLAFVFVSSFLVELVGVRTGMLFGDYSYGHGLGPRMAGVPPLIGLNWILLVVMSAAVCRGIKNRFLHVVAAAAAMTGYDLVMEQICESMSMWMWAVGRVPLRNYATWFALGVMYHGLAALCRIRFASRLAAWTFLVQVVFFAWLFMIFEHAATARFVLGWLMLAALTGRLAVALVNAAARQVRLPEGKPEKCPLVSVLVPARNEKENVANLLCSLRNQTYPRLEVLVYDDLSHDGTADVVRSHAAAFPALRLLPGQALPPGWLGKNHACDRLSREARGDFLLYLDADVTMSPVFIESIMDYMLKNRAALVSVFPEQRMQTFGERVTVPVMLRLLLSLLPLGLVRRLPHASLSAANGQCMLFDAKAYHRYALHREVRSTRVEDIAIARLLKTKGERVACLLGRGMLFCRMYRSYREGVEGFSRNLVECFGGSWLAAVAFGINNTTLLYPLVYPGRMAWLALAVGVNTAVYWLNGWASGMRMRSAFRYQFVQELVFWHVLFRSWKQRSSGKGSWKGRNIF